MECKLYEVNPSTREQIKLLEFLEDEFEIDIWSVSRKSKRAFSILVPSFLQHEFENALTDLELPYKVIVQDVRAIADEERNNNDKVPSIIEGKISFQKYHRYAEIEEYLKYLSQEYPKVVTLKNYGVSYENRNLSAIHIATGGQESKPIIFIDAGIHAREWIAPAQALFILHELIENGENKHMIEKVDWIIIPLANPDGYEYSHTTDRFWRKTRSRISNDCKGVDPNRNFDFHWMKHGASKNLRSQTYAGPCPFSEPETRALSHLIKTNSERIRLYLSIHSCKQCIIYPFGFTKVRPYNGDELHHLAQRVEEAIHKVNGNHYDVGNSPSVLKKTSGSSRDWVYGVAGIDLSYTLELPGGGTRGFDLPPDEILGVVEEIFAGIKIFHKYVQLKYVY
ncbi:hypothetical protein PPYR_10464 [Photinus pyralis]|uniref:Peptidase M14 domain-containing protein n=2 Tax=Photinus pyralis TaxID=7054 RepID=A0A5N4AGH6_PHOPY|nr:hypothetical protein PPYR_10464 [Photinus pyralis]